MYGLVDSRAPLQRLPPVRTPGRAARGRLQIPAWVRVRAAFTKPAVSVRVQYYVCCNIIIAQCPTTNITGNVTFASGNPPSSVVIGVVANFTCSPYFVWYGEASGSTVRSGTCSIVNGTGTWVLQKKCIGVFLYITCNRST